jgi:ATP-dependent DNA helicase DinG
VRVASPFDFKEQARLYVPKHLPDPRNPSYAVAMATELHELICAAGGRTLALFTSWNAMRLTADWCEAHEEYRVLRQGDAPRRTLVDGLRDNAETGGVAVFATMGFWTGVDIPGVGLSLVAIDKIPFPRPNEPLHAARRDRAIRDGQDAFNTIDVPRAALLLAQGTGRLIRHREDRGVVAVLDKRLATAGYRRAILDSLPPFKRTIDGAEVRAFLREITA